MLGKHIERAKLFDCAESLQRREKQNQVYHWYTTPL